MRCSATRARRPGRSTTTSRSRSRSSSSPARAAPVRPRPDGAVTDAVHLAEMWLDPATPLPAGARTSAWTAREWVERTLPTWQRLCDPVARACPARGSTHARRGAAGRRPLLACSGRWAAWRSARRSGRRWPARRRGARLHRRRAAARPGRHGRAAAGQHRRRSARARAARRRGLAVPRRCARPRTSACSRTCRGCGSACSTPWRRTRAASRSTPPRSRRLAGQIDPSEPGSPSGGDAAGMFEPQTTPEQKAALARLETLLALVEGWVDEVVDRRGRRPAARRRRAARDAAPPPRLRRAGRADVRHAGRPRAAAPPAARRRGAVGAARDQHGIEARDSVWEHPDLLPTAEDLDDPMEFAERLGQTARRWRTRWPSWSAPCARTADEGDEPDEARRRPGPTAPR